MRRALTGLLALLLLTTSVAFTSAEEHEEEKYVRDEGTFYSADYIPMRFTAQCLISNCPGLEMTVELDNETISFADPHFIEISFPLQGNVSYTVEVNNGTSPEFVLLGTFDIPYPNSTVFESGFDAIDNIPSPGVPHSTSAFDPFWACSLNGCHDDPPSEMRNYSWIGALEDGSDKDSILINGTAGDVIKIPNWVLHTGIEVEFWQRTNEEKILLTDLQTDSHGGYQFAYPEEGELWLRFKQPPSSGYAAYQFFMLRSVADQESPIGELPNPWPDSPALDFPLDQPSYLGYLSTHDADGDSLLIEAAPLMHVDINCWSNPNIVYFEVYQHSEDGHITNSSLNSGFCPSWLVTESNTTAIEIRMTSEFVAQWGIALTLLSSGDAGGLGDAPDKLWSTEDDLQNWPLIEFDENVHATIRDREYVDVFAFEVSDENGSRFYLDSSSTQPVFYQILILNQTTGAIENSSQGMPINAPPGIHAIRVERVGGDSTIAYDFTLVYQNEIAPPEPPVFIDHSDLFIEYYIFAGVFLLAPAALAVFWNRKRWLGGVTEIEMEQHELRRLRRLRERLTAMLAEDETDEQVIDSALHQLGDSPWQAVVADWGEPLLRHNTQQVEICAWRIAEGDATMLLGIRVADSPWELAAMRVHAPEGASVSISAVSPSHLFMGDEISLNTLAANSRTFLRLTLEGEPSSIGFHLSGLVDGEPLAAVPNRALVWS